MKVYPADGKSRVKCLSHKCWDLEPSDYIFVNGTNDYIIAQAVMFQGQLVVRSVKGPEREFVLRQPARVPAELSAEKKMRRVTKGMYRLDAFSEPTRTRVARLLSISDAEKATEFGTVVVSDDCVFFELIDRTCREGLYEVAQKTAQARALSPKEVRTSINNRRTAFSKLGLKPDLSKALLTRILGEIGRILKRTPLGIVDEFPNLSVQVLDSLLGVHQRWHYDAMGHPFVPTAVLWSVVVLITSGDLTDFRITENSLTLMGACKSLDTIEFEAPQPAIHAPACTVAVFNQAVAHRGRAAILDSFCPVTMTTGRVALYFQIKFDDVTTKISSEFPMQLDKICAPWHSVDLNTNLFEALLANRRAGGGETVETLIKGLIDHQVLRPRLEWPSKRGTECDYRMRCVKQPRKLCRQCGVSMCEVHFATHHHEWDSGDEDEGDEKEADEADEAKTQLLLQEIHYLREVNRLWTDL